MKVENRGIVIYFDEEERKTFREAAAYLQEFVDFLNKTNETDFEVASANYYHADFESFVETLMDLGMDEHIYIS